MRNLDHTDPTMRNPVVKGRDDIPGWGACLGFLFMMVLAIGLGMWALMAAWHLLEYAAAQFVAP